MAANRSNISRMGMSRSDRGNPVMTDRPDMRPVKMLYLLPLTLLIAVILVCLLSKDWGFAFMFGLYVGGMVLVTLIVSGSYHEKLWKAEYTVTSDYIEAQTGNLEKSVRRIPLSYIRDVTLTQNFVQARMDLYNITVAATNGDKVVLQNVTDGKRKHEVIWGLVLAKSPNASMSRP